MNLVDVRLYLLGFGVICSVEEQDNTKNTNYLLWLD